MMPSDQLLVNRSGHSVGDYADLLQFTLELPLDFDWSSTNFSADFKI
jgi:hypothetical protein